MENVKDKDVLILINFLSRRAAGNYFTKHALAHIASEAKIESAAGLARAFSPWRYPRIAKAK